MPTSELDLKTGINGSMTPRVMNPRASHRPTSLLAAALLLLLAGCAYSPVPQTAGKAPVSASDQRIIISVAEQKMVLFEKGVPFMVFAVSTGKKGLGDVPESGRTPLGRLEVAEVIGKGLPTGTRLRKRHPTGEVVPVNAPGRDPIVTRIVRLRGKEKQNANAYARGIYIHGTPDEARLRTAVSHGCVRMRSWQIIRLCDWVKAGARVDILPGRLPAPDKLPP